LGHGEEEDEAGADADFALDFKDAVGLLDDAEDGGEAEAGAASGGFGGEEGFEDAGLGGGVHAAAGIGDGEADPGEFGGDFVAGGGGFVEGDGAGGDGEFA